VTATPTTGPFREAGQVEQLTNAVLNMVAEQSAANMAARAGFNDPALHRLWLALGQLRGKGGLQLNESSLPFGDLADGKGHVGEALPDLVMNGVGCRRLDLTGIDPCHVGLCDRVEVGHEPSPSSVVSTPEGKGSVGSASDDPAETRTTGPFRTLTDHLEDLVRVDEILAHEFPDAVSAERIRVAIEITGALTWGAL
jgi:hypothetical protein